MPNNRENEYRGTANTWSDAPSNIGAPVFFRNSPEDNQASKPSDKLKNILNNARAEEDVHIKKAVEEVIREQLNPVTSKLNAGFSKVDRDFKDNNERWSENKNRWIEWEEYKTYLKQEDIVRKKKSRVGNIIVCLVFVALIAFIAIALKKMVPYYDDLKEEVDNIQEAVNMDQVYRENSSQNSFEESSEPSELELKRLESNHLFKEDISPEMLLEAVEAQCVSLNPAKTSDDGALVYDNLSLISEALRSIGIDDVPEDGLDISHLEWFLLRHGFYRIYNAAELTAGDIVLFGCGDEIEVTDKWSVCILSDYDSKTGACKKYDLSRHAADGSNRIGSFQPILSDFQEDGEAKPFIKAFRIISEPGLDIIRQLSYELANENDDPYMYVSMDEPEIIYFSEQYTAYSVTGSSWIKSDDPYTDNRPQSAFDGSYFTSWIFDKTHEQSLSIKLATKRPVGLISIYNGFWTTPEEYLKYPRPCEVIVKIGDYSKNLMLKDEMKPQYIRINAAINSEDIEITVKSVYDGSEKSEKNCAISEIQIYGIYE